jgi:polysaccharide biosynthesis protein PslJ
VKSDNSPNVDPSLENDPRPRSPADATTLLTFFVVSLVAIPVGYVFGPLGAAGRPAGLIGLVAFVWWLASRLRQRSIAALALNQVRVVALALLAAVLASYLGAYLGPTDAIEGRSADRGILVALGLLGPLLLAADCIPSRDRLDTLLRRLTTCGAVLAGVGTFQFFTGFDFAEVIRFPLLTELGSFQGVQDRSNLNRVAATAAHPIEFGVVVALVFPLALHYALYAKLHHTAAWLRVAVISTAVPFAIARSGVLALAIGFLTMWVSWPARLRIRAAIVAVVGSLMMRTFVPGLLGTLFSLFSNLFYDPSTQGRLDDYPVAGEYIAQRPAFGRGFMTFLPDRYGVLDNQYLGLLIEIGVIGTLAFVLLLLVAIGASRDARRGADEETRSLGQALTASALAVLLTAGTFDLLGFSMAAGIAMLLIGCSGALWRLGRTASGPAPQGASGSVPEAQA